jgi:hypothetical protein
MAAPMNYEAFSNDSIMMMYEGVRGALGADDALKGKVEKLGFAFVKCPAGKTMRLICSCAE